MITTKVGFQRVERFATRYMATAIMDAIKEQRPGLLSTEQQEGLWPILLNAIYTANHAFLHVELKGAQEFVDTTNSHVPRSKKVPNLLASYVALLQKNGEKE